jgi:hypothetical protein
VVEVVEQTLHDVVSGVRLCVNIAEDSDLGCDEGTLAESLCEAVFGVGEDAAVVGVGHVGDEGGHSPRLLQPVAELRERGERTSLRSAGEPETKVFLGELLREMSRKGSAGGLVGEWVVAKWARKSARAVRVLGRESTTRTMRAGSEEERGTLDVGEDFAHYVSSTTDELEHRW